MTHEQWANIMEDIFSFERYPGLGAALFLSLMGITLVTVAIYLKVQDNKSERNKVSIMKRSEYEAKMKALQDEIEALKKVEIEEDYKRWKPKKPRNYWIINGNGVADEITWLDDKADDRLWAMGNCFMTKEEAEFAIEKLKVFAELSGFTEPSDAKWDGDTPHYRIKYDTNASELSIDSNYEYKYSCIYFARKEDAEKAIEAVGEERIKKYYLGVIDEV